MAIVFVVPSDTDAAGGIGHAYARGLARCLCEAGHQSYVEECGPELPGVGQLIIDGLLLPRFQARLPELVDRRAAALLHHTVSRAHSSAYSAEGVADTLKAILPRLSRVIATSEGVAQSLVRDFGVAAGSIAVVTPGVEMLERAAPAPGSCLILSTGVLTRRKRYDALIRMLVPLKDLHWQLTIAGEATRDPSHAGELRALITASGLDERISLLAVHDAPPEHWQQASIFVSTSRWEGYPAAVAQALRRGVAVLATEAAGTLLTPGAGIVLPDDDEATASKVLRRVIYDEGLRQSLADACWKAGQALPNWATQARRFAAVLESTP